MASSAAASTHAGAAEAAMAVLSPEPGESAGTAIDGVLAGVMAIAARSAGVLLGGGTILLGGTGEGFLAIDARPRQPGIDAPRPRGFTGDVPDAAKIAAPLLPAALTLAHAGRGVRTRTALVRAGVSAAAAIAKIDDARVESLRAFGREGGQMLRAGTIADALLVATARSLGGLLVRTDLEALQPHVVQATRLDVDARRWAIAPWAATAQALLEENEAPEEQPTTGEMAVVAAADMHGAMAIATVLVPSFTMPIGDTGLSAPLLARPVMRGVTRTAPGAPLPLPTAIGIAQGRTIEAGKSELGGADLALGLGGAGDVEAVFADVARRASAQASSLDEVLAALRTRRAAREERLDESFGIATAVATDARGRGRPIADPRRR